MPLFARDEFIKLILLERSFVSSVSDDPVYVCLFFLAESSFPSTCVSLLTPGYFGGGIAGLGYGFSLISVYNFLI